MEEPLKLLSLRQTADSLGIPESTLRYWRYLGKGPQGARIGRRVMFRETDVEAFKRSHFEDDQRVVVS